ncbi:hypothetical protein Tco_1509434 [Tanacetum coccineum]
MPINVRDWRLFVPKKEEKLFQVIIRCHQGTLPATRHLPSAWLMLKCSEILDICPRVQGVDYAEVPDDKNTLTFLIDLGYKVFSMEKNTAMKTKEGNPRIESYGIDHMMEKQRRRENMPYPRTEYQLADMFTKALPEERFQYLVRRIGMRCLTPAELEVLTKESA